MGADATISFKCSNIEEVSKLLEHNNTPIDESFTKKSRDSGEYIYSIFTCLGRYFGLDYTKGYREWPTYKSILELLMTQPSVTEIYYAGDLMYYDYVTKDLIQEIDNYYKEVVQEIDSYYKELNEE